MYNIKIEKIDLEFIIKLLHDDYTITKNEKILKVHNKLNDTLKKIKEEEKIKVKQYESLIKIDRL